MTARRRVARGAAVGGAALVAGVGVGVALAGSGGLDPSFGTGGGTVLSHPAETFPADAASAAGGKTVLVASGGGQITVTRRLPDGSPDPTFDTDGVATLTGALAATGAAVLGDGRIVIVGTVITGPTSDVVVWRLKAEGGTGAADGALDPTFDSDGKAVIDSSANDQGDALAVRPDGKIVVAGTTAGSPTPIGVWRLKADGGTGAVNGALDTGFDTDGAAGINDGGTDKPWAVALLPDGRIVLAGETTTGSNQDAAVWRLQADGGTGLLNGSLDTSFDTDGEAKLDAGGNEVARGLVLQPDGKAVIVGLTSNGSGSGNTLAWRLNADGGPGAVNGAQDPSFDTDGLAVIDGGAFETAIDVTRQPDGKLLVAGSQQLGASPAAATLWRLSPNGGAGAVNGALDSSFGSGGAARFDPGGGTEGSAVALQADRRIVVAGKLATGADHKLLAFRVFGDPFAVSVAKAGTGSGSVRSAPGGIDCAAPCSGAFDDGLRVTLSATPASGSTFAGWSGAGCGGTDACGLTMNADQTVTATFNAVPTTSTVAKTHFVLRASRLSMRRFGHRARIVSAIISGLPRRTRLSGALVVGRTTLARAKATAGATGRARLVFRFSRRARKRLRSPKLKAVTLKVTATPPGDTASKASKRIRLKP